MSDENRFGTPPLCSVARVVGLSSSLGMGPRRSQMTERMSGGEVEADGGSAVRDGLTRWAAS